MMVVIVFAMILAIVAAASAATTPGGTSIPSPSDAGTVPNGGDGNTNNVSLQDIFGGLLSDITTPTGAMSFLGGGNTGTNTQFDTFIRIQATQWNLDPVLVKAVIDRESTFNSSAMSFIFDRTTLSKRSDISPTTVRQHITNDGDGGNGWMKLQNIDCSVGLMQVRASYAPSFGLTPNDLLDPEQAIFCGCSMLSSLVKEGATMPDNVDAYNMGIGNWRKGNRNTAYKNFVLGKMQVYANDFS